MRFLTFMAMAIYTFLCVKATQEDLNVAKEDLNVTNLEGVVEDKNLESKLLHEVDDQGADEALEDETIGEEGSNVAEFITAKDANQLKEPELQRSSRSLKSFPNNNMQHSSNNLDIHDDKDDDFADEERAIRRRQRQRRRNTKNKPKRINSNRQVTNRRKATRHRMQNHNSLALQRNTKRSNPKNKKNSTRRSLAKRGSRRSQNSVQQKNNNIKPKRLDQRKRVSNQHTIRRTESEQMTQNSGEKILGSVSDLLTPQKDTIFTAAAATAA